jgi:hypothetical protein
MIKIVTIFSVAFSLVISLGAQRGVAQVPGTQGVTSVFATEEGEVAAYDASSRTLRFFSIARDSAKELASIAVPGQVIGVIALADAYLIATGMGRGDLNPPIRIHKLAKRDLGKPSSALMVVYERVSERPQVTQLRSCGGRVWLGLFESKYNTVIGELVPSGALKEAPWQFSEKVQLRMGDSFDCLGDAIVVGRSYGDSQGQDGDLLLVQRETRTLLPSYRGVRGVESVGTANEPMLVIGDGWHSNYGEMAQGRISLVKKRSGEARFALEVIDLDIKNFNFTKFRNVRSVGGKQYLVALGSSQVLVYDDIFGTATKREVYTQVGKSHLLDFAVGRADAQGVTLVVADEGLHLIRL